MPTTVNTFNRAKAEFFDRQADNEWAAPDYTPEERARIDQVLSRLQPLQGRVVLEPGCGTGRLTAILAQEVGPKGQVLAMDISPRMVDAARERSAGLSNVQLACAPLEDVPLHRGCVDVAFCHQVFPHFDDKAAALEVMANCLRPGGTLVIFHLINIDQINALHRKAGTAVAEDLMPPRGTMQHLIGRFGFRLEELDDGPERYLLLATRA
mgnify:FL=1